VACGIVAGIVAQTEHLLRSRWGMMAEHLNPLDQIKRHLEKTDDPTLLILRTHLLIEERLRDVIARVCRTPEELRPARLTFHQVLCICRALVARHEDDEAWAFVSRLNEVRNRMAHHLEPGDLDELVGSVVEKIRSTHSRTSVTATERFREAAIFACGYFDAIRGSVRLREGYGPEVPLRLPRSAKRRRRKRKGG
jgi:hypothetical protein